MNRVKNKQSGIALMIVLAAITLLTSVSTEFAYETNINYHLAKNQEEKTQAFFLAESAINLMKLELKLEKQLRSQLASSAASTMIKDNMSGPMCQRFPLSTALLRGVFLGQAEGSGATEGTDGEEKVGQAAAFVGGLETEKAKEFLAFEGDFDASCEDESGKFNLNLFFGKSPMQEVVSGVNDYDRSKQLLVNFLGRPEFVALFPENDSGKKLRDIARNVADWVDEDTRISELGGTSTGDEGTLYHGQDYRPKNGKFLSIEELFKVADVDDEWFTPEMKKNFTIYGGDKINVCLASDEIVAGLIMQYVNSDPAIPKVSPTDKEKMADLVYAVKMACGGVNPNVTDIAKALDTALGIGALQIGGGTPPTPVAPVAGGGGFAAMITTESRYYSLHATGIMGDTEIRITEVIDTYDPLPAKWKIVYWRMD